MRKMLCARDFCSIISTNESVRLKLIGCDWQYNFFLIGGKVYCISVLIGHAICVHK